jgi:predicted component of type VI protein secretion system
MTLLETRISQNSWRFDPINLLLVLIHIGYDMDDIVFCSHFSTSSQTRLIVSVEFQESPKKVRVTLNLGLLGAQSLLPNYLFKQVDDNTIEDQRFAKFFGFFDDRLLRRFLLAIYPEYDQSIVPNWDARKKASLQTLKLDSVANLHWLAQLIFPELQVRVEKQTLQRHIDLGAPILGKTQLGYQAVLGKIKKMPVLGKRITLISDEDNFKNNQPWPDEVEQRMQKLLLPTLQGIDLDLEIWLMIRSQSTSLSLKANSYLGYENIEGDAAQIRQIRIFSGRLYDWH